MIEIPLSKTGKHAGKYVAIVDDIDADLAEYNWAVNFNKRDVRYALRTVRDGNLKIHLHRVIMERKLGRPLEKHEFVDHQNGYGTDNRRDNLRLANNSQNQANRGLQRDNKSGLKGASWHKGSKKWKSQIAHNGKVSPLGYFETDIAAHETYCRKAVELHKEFANFGENSPFTPEMFIGASSPYIEPKPAISA